MLQGFVDQPMLVDATTGTSGAFDVRGRSIVAVYQDGTGTVSGGTIVIETAPMSGYGGTWSTALTLDPTDVSGGKTQGAALPAGAYNYVRARISSNITGGGSVSVYLAAV